jgi:hypothetical protein
VQAATRTADNNKQKNWESKVKDISLIPENITEIEIEKRIQVLRNNLIELEKKLFEISEDKRILVREGGIGALGTSKSFRMNPMRLSNNSPDRRSRSPINSTDSGRDSIERFSTSRSERFSSSSSDPGSSRNSFVRRNPLGGSRTGIVVSRNSLLRSSLMSDVSMLDEYTRKPSPLHRRMEMNDIESPVSASETSTIDKNEIHTFLGVNKGLDVVTEEFKIVANQNQFQENEASEDKKQISYDIESNKGSNNNDSDSEFISSPLTENFPIHIVLEDKQDNSKDINDDIV